MYCLCVIILLVCNTNNYGAILFNQDRPFQFLSSLRTKDAYFDATIVCDGKYFKVHRMILSAYSRFLEELFDNAASSVGLQSGHLLVNPVIVLQDVRKEHMEAVVEYIYNGQVNVAKPDLQRFMKTANYLKINGLEDIRDSLESKHIDEKHFQEISTLKSNLVNDSIVSNNPGPIMSSSLYSSEKVSMPTMLDSLDQIYIPKDNEMEFISIKEELIVEGPVANEDSYLDQFTHDNNEILTSKSKKRKLEVAASSPSIGLTENHSILQQNLASVDQNMLNIAFKTQAKQIRVECNEVEPEWTKANFSYTCLIALALKNSADGTLTVTQMCEFIRHHFPYYQTASNGWKKSISCNLSQSIFFERNPCANSKSKQWRIIPSRFHEVGAELIRFKYNFQDALKKGMKYPQQLEFLLKL